MPGSDASICGSSCGGDPPKPALSHVVERSGDGRDVGEPCDDGNKLAEDGCSPRCEAGKVVGGIWILPITAGKMVDH